MNQETTGFFVGPSNQLRNVDLSLTPIPPVYTHPSCLSSFFFPSSSFSRHFSGVVAVESSVRSFLWPVRVVLPIQSVFVLWRVLLLLLALSLSLRPCIPLLRHIFLALPSHHREREKQTKNVRRWNNKKKEQELLQCCCASDSYSTQRTWLSVLFHFLTLFILPDGWDRAWLAGPVIQADVLICQSETWLYQ